MSIIAGALYIVKSRVGYKRVRVREREGADGERVGKGEGGLDLDSCPGLPEFLITPPG